MCGRFEWIDGFGQVARGDAGAAADFLEAASACAVGREMREAAMQTLAYIEAAKVTAPVTVSSAMAFQSCLAI